MHKLPGKRKVSYGADTVAPETPVVLRDKDVEDAKDAVVDAPLVSTLVSPLASPLAPLTPPFVVSKADPEPAFVVPVQDAPSPEGTPASTILAKFNEIRTQLPRSHSRYLVKWKIALIHEFSGKKLTYHGKINDISENGLSMFCEYNVFFSGRVKLIMTLPPLNVGLHAQKIEVESKMVYTILSQFSFRIGLEFLNFQDGEKKILMDRLESSNAALKPGSG
ncbi:PilZ domain-containing protein [Undibacterium sp. CY18W]|uniref:PilZ domain-containing protein n=1 Tax=Undibacterium hunanense TaxID=2762292 RepID=A0ABR6ZXY8_9BURK|nr:PilZ domain-containing protein [Undibacterium hunanense]MBC3920747.1 PilZ domain-containing protein [Undibacterium hunanense]